MSRMIDHEAASLLARAIVAFDAGNSDAAHTLLLEVIARTPRAPAALLLRGELHRRAGNFDAALKDYQRVIDAGTRDAHVYVMKGLAHRARGDRDAARRCFERAVALAPDNADAHGNLAKALADTGAAEIALRHSLHAVACDPANPALRANLGALHLQMGNAEVAWRCLVDDAPADFVAPRDLLAGIATRFAESHDYPRAGLLWQRLYADDPSDTEALSGLGHWLYMTGRFAEAASRFAELIARQPVDARGHYHLGAALRTCGDYAGARHALTRALTLMRTQGAARSVAQRVEYELAFCMLAAEEFDPAWQHYDGRWYTHDPDPQVALESHLWRGEPLTAGRLVVAREQGVGDEILFASMYAELRELAPDLVIQCSSRLAAVFARSFPGIECWPCTERPGAWTELPARLGPDDRVVFAGGLPRWQRRQRADFGGGDAFLRPDTTARDAWRARLGALGRGPRIGLSWRGGTPVNFSGLRSLPLAELLAGIAPDLPADAVLVDLQYDDRRAEIDSCEREFGLTLHRFDITRTDFAATIDLVAALDLVITVQTAVAHVGGALGVPTWVLVAQAPTTLRWLAQDGRTPWYASVRLFEQATAGNWTSALTVIARTLRTANADDRAGGID